MSASSALAWFALLLIVSLYASYVYSKRTMSHADVVCLGDSLTDCGGVGGRFTDFLAKALPGVRVVNKGIGGNTLAQGRARFNRDVISLCPKVVVVELGANDFLQGNRSIEALRDDLEFMVREAHQRGIGVVMASVFGPQYDEDGREIPKQFPEGNPKFGRQILEMEREIAKCYGCKHIENIQAKLTGSEHLSDGRHPSAAGNQLVAEALLPFVKELLETPNPKLKIQNSK